MERRGQLSKKLSPKLNSLGKFQSPLKLKRVKLRDGLSPILLNIVLEKGMKTWMKAISEEGIEGIYVDPKKQGLKVKCLAFTDNLVFLAEDKYEARKIFVKPQETAEE